jgi:hypothetical protein
MSHETAGVFTALLAGAMSVVASSSTVVMPTLIPTVQNIAQGLGENSVRPIYLIAAIILGAHSVAYSPVSTMGALGMASSSAATTKHGLFTKLLLAAAIMLSVTALLFWFGFYGVLIDALSDVPGGVVNDVSSDLFDVSRDLLKERT